MKFCVIGGDGFIGRRVVRRLANLGHSVTSLDVTMATSFADLADKVTVARMDIAQFEDVIAAFEIAKPDVVVNLAYMRETLPRPAMKVNILGMDNCFEAARLCGISHVVYSSSIAVNGSQKPYGPRPVLETDPPCPMKQYSVHKVFNEWQAKEYREKHGMRITGVRAAHVAGTDKLIGSVDHVACIVKPALRQALTMDYADRMRCIIHADDAAEVFARLALAERPAHEIYNSGGETLSLSALADMVRAVIPDADIGFEHETGGEQKSGAYLFDSTRLTREFGISYRPYRERIPEMIAAVRNGQVLG